MTTFDLIKNDQRIIDLYKQIEKYELSHKGHAYHNYTHVMNVTELVEKIISNLGYDEEFIENAKIAAILHDTGATEGKENHPEKGYIFTKQYFEENNIVLKYHDKVLDAIKNHSSGFDSDNIICLSLILADKLDMKSNRITELGKQIDGIRQFQYVNDIKLNIENNNITIDFITTDEFNINEVNEYYFTKKIFKAIKSFSKKLKLTPILLINGEKWKLFYEM